MPTPGSSHPENIIQLTSIAITNHILSSLCDTAAFVIKSHGMARSMNVCENILLAR